MILTFPHLPRAAAPPVAATEAMTARLAALRSYWDSLGGAQGRIPARMDLDPRGLGAALDHIFIAERIGAGILRLRIAGSGLAALAGLDMKGLPLSALFLPPARDPLARACEGIFTRPAALSAVLEAARGPGQPALSGRLLILPLRDSLGASRLVIGCLAVAGSLGHRLPRRFALAALEVEPLALQDAPPPPVPPVPPAPAQPRKAGHLRLVTAPLG